MQILVAAGGIAAADLAATGADRGGFARRFFRRRFLGFGGISALSAALSGLDETRKSSQGWSMHIVSP